MECILLVGGLGTRLKDVVKDVPKPLAKIQSTPFLELLLKQLYAFGSISKCVLALGYKADIILDYFQKNKPLLPLEFSIEKSPLGTGGALVKALEKVTEDVVLVLNGDSYLDFSLGSMVKFHNESDSDFTLACVNVQEGARFGTVLFDETFQVKEFKEKNSDAKNCWINAGVYLLNVNALDAFKKETPFSLEREGFPYLLKKKMMAYPCRKSFIDIGTKKSFEEAQRVLKGV